LNRVGRCARRQVIHAMLDNYAADKHPRRARLAYPAPGLGVSLHTTSCSQANGVETFFAALTRRLRRGPLRSLLTCRPRSTATSPSTTESPSPSSDRGADRVTRESIEGTKR
jgi:hypothetical protein